jgi:predicted GH43/DUF377 family glycosyl hydrolase
MLTLERIADNPILRPRHEEAWESCGSFNGSVCSGGKAVHMVYRGQSAEQVHRGVSLSLSTVGYAVSRDGLNFHDRRQLVVPEHSWEAFGCEDPRITRFEGRYFIFYTALSAYPFSPEAIKVGVAITHDFGAIEEKHPVTTFNSKAMALFPGRVDGKMAAVLSVHTDLPPAKIALARFDDESGIWSLDYWEDWYEGLDSHVIPLLRSAADQVEVGAPPVETEAGWVLVYCDIQDYLRGAGRVFGIQAALLDRDDPSRIIGRTQHPLLWAEAPYELRGFVPRVAFPSGALLRDGRLNVYYGAADTAVALASVDLELLLCELQPERSRPACPAPRGSAQLVRCQDNPIIAPRPELAWEARGTFNPAAVLLDGKVHLVYRALGQDDVSVLGYAQSSDGLKIDERLSEPIYLPREPIELAADGGGCGCEDPRLTMIDERLYLLYTAYNGHDARIALSSIASADFLARRWDWERPIAISAPEIWDKDACLFPRKVDGRYVVIHRLSVGIWIDLVEDLGDLEQHWLGGKLLLAPRPDRWDNRKVGACGPPIETEAGWLFLYHGISEPGTIYSVGAALLDRHDPTRVIARTDSPILEPQEEYERAGLVNNVVFPCGTVVKGRTLFVYYGGADSVVGVAMADLEELVTSVRSGGEQGPPRDRQTSEQTRLLATAKGVGMAAYKKAGDKKSGSAKKVTSKKGTSKKGGSKKGK